MSTAECAHREVTCGCARRQQVAVGKRFGVRPCVPGRQAPYSTWLRVKPPLADSNRRSLPCAAKRLPWVCHRLRIGLFEWF
jgi:hypothetical protein